MSVEGVVSCVRTEVNVDVLKENVVQRDISPDSGAETMDTASVSCPTSSDSEVSPTKHSESPISNDLTSSVELGFDDNSLSKSITESNSSKNNESPLPDDSLSKIDFEVSTYKDNMDVQESTSEMEYKEIVNEAVTNITENNQILVINNEPLENVIQTNISENIEISNSPVENSNFEPHTEQIINTHDDATSKDKENLSTSEDSINDEGENLKMDTKNTLTMSTMSLNDQVQITNDTKSPLSRSAENISTLDSVTVPSSSNSSTKELNTDQILSDFSSHKNKVKATHKIINDTPQMVTTPANYARIPKELLSQDLGSIAKSMHGIFSSVSGSLKNAYNSQRVSVKLPVKNVKPVNGKVMNDIFEDNVPDSSNVDNSSPEKDKLIKNPEESTQSISTDDETEKDLTKLQIESLERVLAEQRKENTALRERVKQQVDELQAKDQTFKELEAKVDLLCKRAEQAHKEKDLAVMRYASVECAAIEAKRAAETAAKAEKAAVAERELLNSKLRSARDERERICQLYDDKCHELKTSEMEAAKLREEARELDGRLKWTQSKLRVEMDAYKESSERAEKLSQQVAELEAARETAVVNATDSAKAKQFEAELKESQAALILCRHEKEELEKRWTSTTQQLDTCRRERDDAREALARTSAQVEQLKESNLRLEEEAAELAALRARAALADTLSTQLQRETERARVAEEALVSERARAETCGRREAAALEHAARLTAQHVAQRAAAAHSAAQAQALAADNASLREQVTSLEAECAKLRTACEEEAERRNRESRVLARKVAELTEESADLSKKLEWEKGENNVLKKKHASAIKELNRELQRAMKRVEQLETKVPRPTDAASTRTGSITSLSSGESAPEERLQNGHAETLPDVQPAGPLPERQALIERIVSLQRAAARRAERCEFLEEHARQLTAELRGKARLLRHVLPALPAGALASHRSDAHKKEIASLGGGAMAALWGGDADGLTPELALEVARRMQAVLEDSLLKNITLKENIDTLGEEIARLRKQVNSNNETK